MFFIRYPIFYIRKHPAGDGISINHFFFQIHAYPYAMVFRLLLCITLLYLSLPATCQTDFVSQPKLSWKYKTNKPIIASPTVSANLVFFGGLDSTMHAVEIQTGKLIWSFKTGGEIRSTVCLSGEEIFFYSGDAFVYCLNQKTGKLKWKFQTKGGLLGDRRHDFADYFQSSPVINGDRLFIGGGDERVYALSVKDGQVLWTFKTHGIVHTTPALDATRIYIGSFDGYLYAIDQRDGRECWKFKTVGHAYFPDGEVQGSPVISNGVVYFGARDYNLYALDSSTGTTRWNKRFPYGWAMALAPLDSVIYAGTSDDRVLTALDAKTGTELWRSEVGFNVFGPCVYSASMAYVGTLAGKLHGIALRDGVIKWSIATDGHNSNRDRYFKPDDSFRDDITKVIKTPADFIEMEYALGAIFSTPAIARDKLLVTSTDGSLYCYAH